jgi:flagellar protein FliL
VSEPLKDEAADGETPPKAAPAKKKGKLIAIAAAGLLIVGGGGGAAAWTMLGKSDPGAGDAPSEEAKPGTYIEVPPMTVNLRSGDGKPRFLKLRFILVTEDAGNEDTINEKLPLILDGFQPFLRELRPEDLAGSAAVFRLKEEMLSRASRVAGPGVVTDVLIQDLIQQ